MLHERILDPGTLRSSYYASVKRHGEEGGIAQFYRDMAAELNNIAKVVWEASERTTARQIQELTVPSVHGTEVYGDGTTFIRSKAVDLGFLEAYEVSDFTNTPMAGFDVHVYNDNITVGIVEPGENMTINAVSSSDSFVRFIKHAGGVAWAREWIEDEKFYMFDDMNRQLLGSALRVYAELGYSILETAAQSNVTYATTPTGGSQAMLDAETIWDAARIIIQNVEDQLPGANLDLETSQFVLITPLESVRRNLTAMAVTPTTTNLVGGPMIAKPNIRLVPTNRLTTVSRLGLLVLAGFEIKWGDRQRNQVRTEFAMVKDSEVAGISWRANGAVGNANQIEVVPSS